MIAIPTESRIFADRYCRELRQLEALHAGRISSGTKTWREAVPALFTRMRQSGSPAKQAAVLRKAIAYLKSIPREDTTHIMIASSIASRSAHLCFATFTVDLHPFIGVDEQGIKIMQHFGRCDRNGSSRLISDIDLAYVSRHAIGRLHEREHNLTSDGTTGGLACVGVLGYLTRNSAKHVAPMRSTIGKCAIRAALLVMWSPRGSPIRRTMTAHSPTKFRSCRAAPTTTRFARRW